MNRIGVILPYFGRLPNTWSLTHESMRRNGNIDWIIFTDQELIAGENVKVFPSTLSDFQKTVSKRLGFPVALDRPYKVCDFRPAFGYVFSEILKDYDFWGYCDADVIFGDLSKSIAAGLESGAEKIFQRGHLSLVRNTQRMNNLFLTTSMEPKYEVVFTDPRNYLFDEGGGFYQILESAGVSIFEDNNLFDIIPTKFQPVASSTSAKKPIYFYRDGGIFEYDQANKTVLREGRYIHLQKRPYWADSQIQSLSDLFGNQVGVFMPDHIQKRLFDDLADNRSVSPTLTSYRKWLTYQIRRKRRKNTIARNP